jgi:hypothetical protein
MDRGRGVHGDGERDGVIIRSCATSVSRFSQSTRTGLAFTELFPIVHVLFLSLVIQPQCSSEHLHPLVPPSPPAIRSIPISHPCRARRPLPLAYTSLATRVDSPSPAPSIRRHKVLILGQRACSRRLLSSVEVRRNRRTRPRSGTGHVN